jgi:hypothetical protein
VDLKNPRSDAGSKCHPESFAGGKVLWGDGFGREDFFRRLRVGADNEWRYDGPQAPTCGDTGDLTAGVFAITAGADTWSIWCTRRALARGDRSEPSEAGEATTHRRADIARCHMRIAQPPKEGVTASENTP